MPKSEKPLDCNRLILLYSILIVKDMIEVRINGRGGQGAKTAAQLLAEAAMDQGKHIQSFPEYGPERAGAPIRAYTRISDHPINIHSGVTHPDIAAVIDPTLLESVNVTEGMGDNSVLLINTDKTPAQMRKQLNFNKGKLCTVDATKIALDTIGLPLPNTAILGAIVKATGIVKLEDIEKQIKSKFLKKIGEQKTQANIDSVQRAYKEVQEG